jgi:hypothetical protein
MIKGVVTGAMAISAAAYASTAVAGYLTFGACTADNLLLNLGENFELAVRCLFFGRVFQPPLLLGCTVLPPLLLGCTVLPPLLLGCTVLLGLKPGHVYIPIARLFECSLPLLLSP